MSFIDNIKNKLNQTVIGKWESNEERITTVTNRLNHCYSCDKFINITQMCSECGCFMKVKTQLKNAKCPLGKW